MSVAKIIAEQIGKEALFMIGTKHLVEGEDSLIIHLKRGAYLRNFKITHVSITLNHNDLYNVEFFCLSKKTMDLNFVAKFEDCYGEQLRSLLSDKLKMDVVIR